MTATTERCPGCHGSGIEMSGVTYAGMSEYVGCHECGPECPDDCGCRASDATERPESIAPRHPGATQSPDWSPRAAEGLRGAESAVSDAEAERVWIACGRGICAAESGHEGTCDEASGWADVSPARDAVSDAEAAECARLTIDAELPWSIAVPRLLADRERLMDALADEAKVAEVSKAFHRLVVAERDFERGKNDRLRVQRDGLRALRVQRDGLRATVRSMLGDAAAEGRCGCVALCEGPQEDCPLHGRDYAWWVGLAGTACADREWLMAENARLTEALYLTRITLEATFRVLQEASGLPDDIDDPDCRDEMVLALRPRAEKAEAEVARLREEATVSAALLETEIAKREAAQAKHWREVLRIRRELDGIRREMNDMLRALQDEGGE